jgi:hypothetical protein
MATSRYRYFLHDRLYDYFGGTGWGPWTSYYDGLVNATDLVQKDTGSFPNYRDRIARCIGTTTPLHAISTDVIAPNSDFIHTERYLRTNPNNKVMFEATGCFSYQGDAIPDADSFIVQSVENYAISDCVKKIRKANTSLQGLVALGELGETGRMVNSAGRQLFRGVNGFLNDVTHLVRTVNPKRLVSTIGRKWLEYSFGWKPLINDIDDGIHAIRRIAQNRPPRILIRTKGSSSVKKPPLTYSRILDGFRVDVTSSYSNIYSVRLYGAVSIQLKAERIPHEFGIKLDEFIPTVWELIPYSFLADYFVNLGAIIDAYSLNTSTVRWLNKGTLSEVLFESQCSAVPQRQAAWVYTNSVVRLGPPFRYSRKVKNRVAYSPAWLIPSLEFTIPGMGTQWLNMGALASQHLSTSTSVRRAIRL